MLFKEDELKFMGRFYLSSFILGLFSMIAPYSTIYFRNLGLSFFQIAIIGSAISAGMFLFEVPTGAFADCFSRKYSTLLSFAICGSLLFSVPFFTDFYALVIIWFLIGVGLTFQSGAAESWVIDNLILNEKEYLKNEFFIKSGVIASAGMIIAPFLGALIVKYYSITLLWHVLGIGFWLAVLILLSCEEAYKPKRTSIKAGILDSVSRGKEGLQLYSRNKTLFLITLAGIFISLTAMGDEGWQPFLVQLSMPEHYLGYVASLMSLLFMVTPFAARYFEKRKVKYVLPVLMFIKMILLLSILLINPPFYYLAVLISMIDGNLSVIGGPLLETTIHKQIPTKIRATAVSVENMILQGTRFIIGIIGGYALDLFGPQKVIALSGLFAIFAIITYLKLEE